MSELFEMGLKAGKTKGAVIALSRVFEEMMQHTIGDEIVIKIDKLHNITQEIAEEIAHPKETQEGTN